MKTLLRPIAFNETSHEVSLLHRTLDVLGHSVVEREVLQRKAGSDTRTKVRALQKQLNVASDPNLLMDENTVAAAAEELRRRGLTEASRSFTIAGTVRQTDGATVGRQSLMAFDLDLKGVAVYRLVQSLEELDKSGGFEYLGRASSDPRGAYRITFYDWQYRRAERKMADVVVYAVEEDGKSLRLIGRSRLIQCEEYSDKGLVRDLNVTVAVTDRRTEYTRVMTALRPFLQESESSLAAIGASEDQIGFTASELDLKPEWVRTAAAAEALLRRKEKQLTHEPLYGIGRQGIRLLWPVLYRKSDEELRAAVERSAAEGIIQDLGAKQLEAFLAALRNISILEVLDQKIGGSEATVRSQLAVVLPEERQQAAFLRARAAFRGSDFRDFWHKELLQQPEFRDNPGLVERLLFAQQLTLFTGDHQPLVQELLVKRKLATVGELFDLATEDWLEILKSTGVPANSPGEDEEERALNYAASCQQLLDAAFPSLCIAGMLKRSELPIDRTTVARGVSSFLEKTPRFDFASSRVHDFEKEIASIGGRQASAVRSELLKLQRVFQVSPSPEAMRGLLEGGMHSANAIFNVPRKSFIRSYGEMLGGEDVAFAVHQRAEHIAVRAEFAAMKVLDYAPDYAPKAILGDASKAEALTTLKNLMPNYSVLFGSPDLCECQHCRSVLGAAAYMVDLLRFLWRGEANFDGQTPLDMLTKRRPDLLHLPLTCENTNTEIPYIDLASEVMEYYTVNGSLAAFTGHSTGEATAEELRANPQNVNVDAYRRLATEFKYPFSLPYHQPLDVIRVHGEHLKTSRYEVLMAVNPDPDPTTAAAIAAEALLLSEEEYKVLTGVAFDGTPDATDLWVFYGYAAAADLEDLRMVQEFMRRSGVSYVELVELMKTQFLNPFQGTLAFVEAVFKSSSVGANNLYPRLAQIAAGTLDPAADADVTAALTSYNNEHGVNVTAVEFGAWVVAHFAEFREVITLYEPDSRCNLETTEIRSLRSIYEALPISGVANETWSRVHRFIRLWRRLGWTVHDLDLVLKALGDADITADTIAKLEAVKRIQAATKSTPSQLAVIWGSIDAYGEKSLYRKLFLNKSVQVIDPVFEADAWGTYLSDGGEVLVDHQSAILAAFRMREEDLAAVLSVARVLDAGAERPLDLAVDSLSLANLSTIYRYVALAKALKLKVVDLCTIVTLFGIAPFSQWDVQQARFLNIDPQVTDDFISLAASIKKAGFKASVLEYVLRGTLQPDSSLGLDTDEALAAAKTIRETFAAIDQEHPDAPTLPLTAEVLAAKLGLTFQAEQVTRFMAILAGTETFQTFTDLNLALDLDRDLPEDLAAKYTYVKGSGLLTSHGVMTDDERDTLRTLPDASAGFATAVDTLYAMPEEFLRENFSGIFTNPAKASKTLLDHPTQLPPATYDERLEYVYELFIPVLKSKLRRDAIAQHVASLIGLSEETTSLLIQADVDALVADLSTAGHSATYFLDSTWTNPGLLRTDPQVEFVWGLEAPDSAVPANNFSVRWEAYLAAPASGEYTLRVHVAETDEAFRLYLDGELILEKPAAAGLTTWDKVLELNAARMHLLRLDYAEVDEFAGITLEWMTKTSAPEVIPPSAAYPARILDDFTALVTVYHRAAEFINGFDLSEKEVQHLLEFAGDFGGLDFQALSGDHWRRVSDYAELRDTVPQSQALLTEVFRLANNAAPVPTLAELQDLLVQATAWDAESLDFLVNTHFGFGVADFRNEIAANRMRAVMQVAAKSGLTAPTIAEWGEAGTNFDALHDTAQLIKNTVKAKYEEKDWLQVAGELSDVVRKNQQKALVAHLLTRPEIQTWGAEDADGLFEFLLIDVQMCSCMNTSRIVQANAAIQMYVNRCLLNLESDVAGGNEHGVSPTAIDKDRWEWMKAYRVWEANRKVFMYPENWLEPDWRNDRSEFFKELESYLVQNDITESSVEQALRNYLGSLSEVAHLEVRGFWREAQPDGKARKYLHVFGRTHAAPYKYFYRRWNEFAKWSAWERVAVDIRSVESGEDSGVHLMPVVWKNRLFLFWPEYILTKVAPEANETKSAKAASEEAMSSLEAKQFWEIRLAWSEYVDGKWSPKSLSKEFITKEVGKVAPHESNTRWIQTIDARDRLSLVLHFEFEGNWVEEAAFRLADISSAPEVVLLGDYKTSDWDGYRLDFMNYAKESSLVLADDEYLSTPVDHRILMLPVRRNYLQELGTQFFFSDLERTYFVRPREIQFLEALRTPDKYKPYMLDIVYEIEPVVDISGGGPLVGPDDYHPGPGLDPEFPPEPMPGMLWTAATGAARMAGTAVKTSEGGPGVRMAAKDDPTSRSYAIALVSVPSAFAGTQKQKIEFHGLTHRTDVGLEFHTFYHPYVNRYLQRFNEEGISGLFESDTLLPSDEGTLFVDTYDPNFTNGFVQRPDDFANRTYYKESVCFDVYGANSLYNWELFYHVPLYIATRLSKNGKYEEAMKWFHYIFDPTTDAQPGAGESEEARYWNFQPFKTTPTESLEEMFLKLEANNDPTAEERDIAEWRNNPFDPHLVAANRPVAYMKHVVIKYVENLIAWGDSLFRQFQRETVYEAMQLYVIANHVLGPRPQFVPERGAIAEESFESLRLQWDDFSNALVELENLFPYSSAVSTSTTSTGSSMLGVGPALYFCIPANDKLLNLWTTTADRLDKIRNCKDIEGIERTLALFSPPIDPAALILASSQGLSLGSILADLSSPAPIYRFSLLIQKANEFCSDVRGLGTALLAALEKMDAEELSRLRASHETQILELITAIKERQVLDAKANRENVLKARQIAEFRLQHYLDLLGNEPVTVPPPETINASLTADSQLPADTNIQTVEPNVDESLVDSEESGVKLIPHEASDIALSRSASDSLFASASTEVVSGFLGLIPQFDAEGTPLGVGAGAGFGGRELSWFAGSMAKMFSATSSLSAMAAARSAKMAAFIRREQDWTLQANLAGKEIIQLDKQITSSDIRLQIAEKELESHLQQIENSKEVALFLKDKFTNQELYQWMKEQLFAVYKQSYNLAYEMAKRTEKAYQLEIGVNVTDFIQYGYWDNSKQGLVAGEKLQLALRQMEKSYLECNRRELELTKNVSLARLNPVALIQLRESGKCNFSLPEELFDLDFRGHYFRRIKSVSLTIPCVAGPYSTVNCTLRLLNSCIRVNSNLGSGGQYEHENDEGIWVDDGRFRSSNTPVTAIATSTAQNDPGVFNLNFFDDRYLPFELAGAVGDWQLELSTEKDLRSFDYATISDAILRISYTAREAGGSFKEEASDYIQDFLRNVNDLAEEPLVQQYSMKRDFPGEWYRFLHPTAAAPEQVLRFTLGKERFPYLAQGRKVVVMQADVFARCTRDGEYHLRLSYRDEDGALAESAQIPMPTNGAYDDINKVTIGVSDHGLNLDELDVDREMTLKLKFNSVADYEGLDNDPEEIEDLFLVLHYRLDDE